MKCLRINFIKLFNRFKERIVLFFQASFALLAIFLVLGYSGFYLYGSLKLYFHGQISEMTIKELKENPIPQGLPEQILTVKEVNYEVWTDYFNFKHLKANQKIIVLFDKRIKVGIHLLDGKKTLYSIIRSKGGGIIPTALLLLIIYFTLLLLKLKKQLAKLHYTSYNEIQNSKFKPLAFLEYLEKMTTPIFSIILIILLSLVLFKITLELEEIANLVFGFFFSFALLLNGFAFAYIIPTIHFLRYEGNLVVKFISKLGLLLVLSHTIYKTIDYLLVYKSSNTDKLTNELIEYGKYIINI